MSTPARNLELKAGATDRLRNGSVRSDFPLLSHEAKTNGLVFLDSAASSQKPQVVLDTVTDVYSRNYANIHRGVYRLSQEATRLYEEARTKVQDFLNAADEREIVFVRGATEAINLLAHSFVRPRIAPGDEILVTQMEHHSNLVPWQLLCQSTGAVLKYVPLTDTGELEMSALETLITDRTRVISVAHVSNALGTINPVKTIVRLAHEKNIPVIVDGAQATPHLAVDVQDLDCDFYVFSGHKVYGPTGVGAVYGKSVHWEAMPPWQGGGDMILNVTMEQSTYAPPPARFEAGTPHIAGAIGLGAAIDYMQDLGLDAITAHEEDLLQYGNALLTAVPGLRLIGTAAQKAGVFSFVLDGVHPHDVGTVLDTHHIAVRTGHHCAQPVMDRFQVPATTRASLGLYNTRTDLDALAEALLQVRKFFGI